MGTLKEQHISKKIENQEQFIEIINAKEHNLKNISVNIPRNQLVVFTGLSGSGKSSLAFDTIYAEAQRRFLETLSAYARQFMGELERPDVDKINGLSPAISIEQKTVSKNPRSTVGTITEVYDFLRLLFTRTAEAFSYVTGKKMVKYTIDQIFEIIQRDYVNKEITILAPLIYGRKGHYNDLFNQLLKKGYTKARIDGTIEDIHPKLRLDRYKVHNIELLVDIVEINIDNIDRLKQSINTAIKLGENKLLILDEKSQPKLFSLLYYCEESGISYDEPAPNSFSFNSVYGWCPTCRGIGTIEHINYQSIVSDNNLNLPKALNKKLLNLSEKDIDLITQRIDKEKFDINSSVNDFIKAQEHDKLNQILIYYLFFSIHKQFKIDLNDYFSDNLKEYDFSKVYKLKEFFTKNKIFSDISCPTCDGKRLKKESLFFKINNTDIGELSQQSIYNIFNWLKALSKQPSTQKQIIQEEILKELIPRVEFLLDVGLGYLSLNLPAYALSGGEAQRIRLATQLGSQLINVLYILDEPSIGLHQRDNHKLIQALKKLRDIGNSVIVVEHDKEMITESDFVIDIGPGAGKHGGHIIVADTPNNLLKKEGYTSDYLTNKKKIFCPEKRRNGNGNYLSIYNCLGNNLKNIDVQFPLGKFICVTGVSGSGKSTLVMETLLPAVKDSLKYVNEIAPYPFKKLEGIEHIDRIIEIDQSPIGRTPRSNPATYTKVFDEIRALFAETSEAKIRGFKQGRFSFNVKGGRCEECGGAGIKNIEMLFLPDVSVTCPVCLGKRYNRETLVVKFKGKNINDVLNMPIEEACVFFENQPSILKKLKTLNDIGLGYIQLGQPSTTLSGGEAQRIKLAAELYKKDTGKTLYILDEPTTGLHFEDINKLLIILHKLVDNGNTIIVIEHNMDVIKTADHIIDIGPEGGNEGGRVLFEGTPEQMIKLKNNDTAKFLKLEFQ